MTQDEQRQLDRMELKVDSFMRAQAALQVAQAAHEASSTTAHGLADLSSELQATRRDVVKLGAIIGGVTLLANAVAVTVVVRMVTGA